jgi:hypothetical protein
LVVVGVFNTSFERRSTGSGTNWHGGQDLPVATGASPEPAQASVLRELEGAGLRGI